MLKIKDSVDLKELEKFGFKYENGNNPYYYKEIALDEINTFEFHVWDAKRIIELYIEDQEDETLNIDKWVDDEFDFIFDLIQAGLVEKVES